MPKDLNFVNLSINIFSTKKRLFYNIGNVFAQKSYVLSKKTFVITKSLTNINICDT